MRTTVVGRLLAIVGMIAVGGAALSTSAFAADPNVWTPKAVTGMSPTDFLFGESCPTNTSGTVTRCFAEADTSDNTTLNPNGLKIYTTALNAGSGDPTVAGWTTAFSSGANGVGDGISCVDPGTTGAPNISCYSVGSAGNLVECNGSELGTPGTCDGTAGNWDTRVIKSRGNVAEDLYAISCADRDHCVAVGTNGTILSSKNATLQDNAGVSTATWTDIGPDTNGVFLFSVVCPNAITCYAGGATVTAGGYSPVLYMVTTTGPLGVVASITVPSTVGSINGLACANYSTDATACFAAADNNILSGTTLSWLVTTAPGGGLGIACSSGSGGKDCSAGGYSGQLLSTANGATWVKESTAAPVSTAEFDGANCFQNVNGFCQVEGRTSTGGAGRPVIYGRARNNTGSVTAPTRIGPPSTNRGGPTAKVRVNAAAATGVRAATAATAAATVPRLPNAGHSPVPSQLPAALVVALSVGLAITVTGGLVLSRRSNR